MEKEIGNQVSEIVTIVDKHERSDAKSAMIDAVLSSLEDEFPEDTRDIKSIIEDHFKKGFREFLNKALPLTFVTAILFIVCVIFLTNYYVLSEAIYKVIFIGLASLTFPHILLEYLIEKNEE